MWWVVSLLFIRTAARRYPELFKWLAEYTRRTPWCYFFLEDTNIAWLYPENIDRVVINPASQFRSNGSGDGGRAGADFGMRSVTVPFEHVKSPSLSYLAHSAQSKFCRSRLCKDFVTEFGVHFKAAVAALESPSILLSGAPGIGKTHFMKDFRKVEAGLDGVDGVVVREHEHEEDGGYDVEKGEEGYEEEKGEGGGDGTSAIMFKFVDPDVDGSDDIFTRVALRDVLQKRAEATVAGDNVKKILIVDEVCARCKECAPFMCLRVPPVL
jgi:hypothetical protein